MYFWGSIDANGFLTGPCGTDLEGVDGVRIWQDQALFKLPYAQQTYWHQDNPIWSFDSKLSQHVSIPLLDTHNRVEQNFN